MQASESRVPLRTRRNRGEIRRSGQLCAGSGFELFLTDSIPFHQLVQLTRGDSRGFCRIFYLAMVQVQLFLDVFLFDLFQTLSPGLSQSGRCVKRDSSMKIGVLEKFTGETFGAES